jgi:hypothetical protein
MKCPYAICITRKEAIYVICQRTFFVILSNNIEKLFSDVDLILAIRNFEGSFITMKRNSLIEISLSLDGDLLVRNKYHCLYLLQKRNQI